jgi:hypothetical protein
MCALVRVNSARLKQLVAITHVVAGPRVRQSREFDIVNPYNGRKRKSHGRRAEKLIDTFR